MNRGLALAAEKSRDMADDRNLSIHRAYGNLYFDGKKNTLPFPLYFTVQRCRRVCAVPDGSR